MKYVIKLTEKQAEVLETLMNEGLDMMEGYVNAVSKSELKYAFGVRNTILNQIKKERLKAERIRRLKKDQENASDELIKTFKGRKLKL